VTLPPRSTAPTVAGCRLVGCSVVSGRPLRSRAVAGVSRHVCVCLVSSCPTGRCRIKADGRQQEKGSCGNTFAPTSKFSCIRPICALASQEGLTVYQFDIKGTFLMAPCKEDIYLNLPGKYRLPKEKVLKLKKYIYGLHQSVFTGIICLPGGSQIMDSRTLTQMA
jgi:hypothetical protein